ncbi:MAG: hypothetical protein PVI21_05105 [Candidatus Woesebacteria bacterium]
MRIYKIDTTPLPPFFWERTSLDPLCDALSPNEVRELDDASYYGSIFTDRYVKQREEDYQHWLEYGTLRTDCEYDDYDCRDDSLGCQHCGGFACWGACQYDDDDFSFATSHLPDLDEGECIYRSKPSCKRKDREWVTLNNGGIAPKVKRHNRGHRANRKKRFDLGIAEQRRWRRDKLAEIAGALCQEDYS